MERDLGFRRVFVRTSTPAGGDRPPKLVHDILGVDTTWIIEYLRGNQEIVQRLDSLRDVGPAVAIISVAEPYEGVYRSSNPSGNESRLMDFLTGVTVLGIDEDVCRVFGRERARLR